METQVGEQIMDGPSIRENGGIISEYRKSTTIALFHQNAGMESALELFAASVVMTLQGPQLIELAVPARQRAEGLDFDVGA